MSSMGGAGGVAIEPYAGLSIENITVDFGRGARKHRVLKGVSARVGKGRTVGLVGESGSGKSTLAKALVGTVPLVSGQATFDGRLLVGPGLSRREREENHRRVQLIPQDPYSSLDPRRTIGETLAEALDPKRARVAPVRGRLEEALEEVQLPGDMVDRYPHEFSGGQRQRIAIARALLVEPDLVIADEITSALDVSVQAQVLDLLEGITEARGLTMLFISHNMAVISRICDDVIVLFHGDVVEQAPALQLFSAPREEYTRTLLESIPGSPTFSLV